MFSLCTCIVGGRRRCGRTRIQKIKPHKLHQPMGPPPSPFHFSKPSSSSILTKNEIQVWIQISIWKFVSRNPSSNSDFLTCLPCVINIKNSSLGLNPFGTQAQHWVFFLPYHHHQAFVAMAWRYFLFSFCVWPFYSSYQITLDTKSSPTCKNLSLGSSPFWTQAQVQVPFFCLATITKLWWSSTMTVRIFSIFVFDLTITFIKLLSVPKVVWRNLQELEPMFSCFFEMPSLNSNGSSTMATRAWAWAQVQFWTQAIPQVFFFFGFFVFDLVVVLAKLFSVMKIVQQELPKFETKLEFFLKCHCWALMGAQGWQQKLELGLGSILVFLFFFFLFFLCCIFHKPTFSIDNSLARIAGTQA